MNENEPIIRQPNAPPPFRKGDELVVTTESAAFNGLCVSHVEGMALFVAGCVPGDTVRVRVTKKKSSFGEARTLEVLAPGPDRVEPPCIYFGDCGGCKWQNLAYDAQLRWKRQHVVDAFERIGGMAGVEVMPTLACPREYWYRNKMEFSFGAERWVSREEIESGEPLDRDFAVGLHIPGRYDKILDIEKCWLQSETSNRILNLTRAFALSKGLPSYSTSTHTGFLRNLVVRNAEATGEIMVILVTADRDEELMREYAALVQAEIPEVTTLLNGVNRKKAQIAFSEEIHLEYGPGTITEEIAGNRFTLSPFSFFQTNTRQGDNLFRLALDGAAVTAEDHVWDLYCGAGTITLAAARRAGSVLGIELNEVAVVDARRNAEANGIANVEFIAGDLKDVIGSVVESGAGRRPDIVIVDPPRAGLHADVVEELKRLAPTRIVYVSCNPTTQARDVALLADEYSLGAVHPVDMFPQTFHIETVTTLTRK